MAVNLSFIGGAGWQFFDDSGNPLSGGKIYTYAAGTTTPQTTYTSRSGTTPNTNPIVLDAAGRTPEQIWSTEGLLYKYVVKTSTDVLIRSWDNIGGSVVASNLAQDLASTTDNAKGDALIGFKQSNSSGFATNAVARTVNTKLQEIVSVKDFGAVGDGIVDDFLAINRAAAYISSLGGGTVFYPAGTYRITRSIRLDDFNVETNTYSGNVRRNVVHQGAGRDSTIIKTDGFYACAFTSFPEPWIPNASVNPAPVIGNVLCSNIVIKDMTIDGNKGVVGDGGTTYGLNYQTSPPAVNGWPNGYIGPSYWSSDNYQFGIHLYYGEQLLVENVHIKSWWYAGVLGYGAARMEIHNNFIENCGEVATVLGYYPALEFDQRTNTVSATDNVIQICGNGVFSGTGAGATSPCTDIEISNNIFYGISPGNGIYARDYQSRWVVADNVFDGIGNQGIVFTNEQPGWPATQLPKNISITGNIINEFNLLNGIGAAGIAVVGHQFVVANNTITQTNGAVTNPTFAIRTNDTVVTVSANERKGMIITGNMVTGKFPNNAAGLGIFYIDSDNTLVANNQIMSNGSAAQTAITLLNANSVVKGNNILGAYIQGNRAIFDYAGSSNMYVDDNRYGAITAIHTTVASGSISGSNNVDFSGLSTVVDIDNRANYDASTDSITPDLPGVYEFTAVLRVTAASASLVQGVIELNNTTVIANGMQNAGAGDTVTVSLTCFATLTGSDVVRLKATVTTGNYVIEPFASLSAKFIRQTNL